MGLILDEGIEKLATDFATLLTKGQWGTGTTAPTTSDTGLETPVAATLLALTSASASGATATFQHEVPSTTANGSELTEFELQFANGDSFDRSVGGAISKTASFEVVTITSVSFIRG